MITMPWMHTMTSDCSDNNDLDDDEHDDLDDDEHDDLR